MKKILTAILTAALLISSAGCQTKQPQAMQNAPEPAPQALVLNVGSPTKIADERIDTGTAIEQIITGLKIKVDTAEKKKATTQAKATSKLPPTRLSRKRPQSPGKTWIYSSPNPPPSPRL